MPFGGKKCLFKKSRKGESFKFEALISRMKAQIRAQMTDVADDEQKSRFGGIGLVPHVYSTFLMLTHRLTFFITFFITFFFKKPFGFIR